MANFATVVPSLKDEKGVRREEWGAGSIVYANVDGQLMRTPTLYPRIVGGNRTDEQDYGWTLDLNDLLATDWQVVDSTSTRPQMSL